MKHQKINNKPNNQQSGFSVVEIALVVVACGIIGAAGLAVAAHNRHVSQTADLASGHTTTSSKSALSQPNASSTPTLSTATTTSLPATISTPSKTKTSTTSSTKTSTTTTASPPSAPAPTLLSTLTALIAGLDDGQSVQVTATTITIPGPVTDATGRPIVFSFNGTTYFAYRQGQPIDFNQTPAQTANTLAWPIGNLRGTTLTQAHLDKLGNLVDENEAAVGYSTGGG